jgi:hypothetical protein
MIDINISANIKEVSKKLSDLAYKELPFATARALTELAREVQAAERFGMESVFDKPKTFTLNSVRVFGATKDTLTAGIFVMDKIAQVLSPFEIGGNHFLNPGQNWLHVPVQAPQDAGGNVPRNYERKGDSRKSVFFGIVQTAKGPINGMWKRTIVRQAGPNGKLRKVHKLKLLVEYVRDKPVQQHLEFFDRAQKLVNRRYQPVLGAALAKAIASSKFK